MPITVPDRLAATCRASSQRSAWLERLPDVVANLARRWSLTLGTPFDGADGTCAWVAPAVCADGTAAVLKMGMPHMEAEHEIEGLRFWNGDPTVQLLDADDVLGALLLERCQPGTDLRELPEPQQDIVITALLRRLWRVPSAQSSFRPLSELTAFWTQETLAAAERWTDAGLVRAGLELFRELPRNAPTTALLATDLHAGNVLRAERALWLVIDPKPFVGDLAYDATQHLLNCEARMHSDPDRTISDFADLLGVDHQRVRLWLFARAAAEPRDDWESDQLMALARTLAP